MGWVVLIAGAWGLLWVMIAAAAGTGLAAAATALFRTSADGETTELTGGYNALAPFVDR